MAKKVKIMVMHLLLFALCLTEIMTGSSVMRVEAEADRYLVNEGTIGQTQYYVQGNVVLKIANAQLQIYTSGGQGVLLADVTNIGTEKCDLLLFDIIFYGEKDDIEVCRMGGILVNLNVNQSTQLNSSSTLLGSRALAEQCKTFKIVAEDGSGASTYREPSAAYVPSAEPTASAAPTLAPTVSPASTSEPTVSPIVTDIPASAETRLFKDYLHTKAIDAECATVYANGINTKQGANKTATIYTNIKASYRYWIEKEKLKIATGKIVVGITSKAEKPTLDSKNRIVDAAGAEVASAKFSHGQIKVTAKKKPGTVWLWVVDTGDEGQSASCPITVKAAPTTLKVRETAESTQDYKKVFVDVGNSKEVFVAPTYKLNGQDVETGDATYSAAVQKGYEDYFDAKYEGGKKIRITVKKLKEDKRTTARITIKCDQSGKSVVLTAVGVNRTKMAALSADEGTNFADDTVTLTKSTKEDVKGSIQVNAVCVNETIKGTDAKKIYAMPNAGAYDKTKADNGTVSILGKLSSAQKKISAKFSSDGKKIEIKAKKGASGEVHFLVYYNAGCYKEFAVKVV